MSNTPRTDRYELHIETWKAGKLINPARELELELAFALKEKNDALTAIAMLGDRHERELAEVIKQRDELAASLKSMCRAIISEEPRDITDLLKQSGAAIAAVKGGQS
jgi:non-homologous end joining protein Ku